MMRDRFVCPYFEIELSDIQVSYTEENPRFKDSFFTKYSFPFYIYIDTEVRLKMGDYDKFSAVNLKKSYEGFHVLEGKIKKATLEILNVEGNKLEVQLDSGFEELPNFDKKLSELPFETIQVDNIYIHADTVCRLSYPDTTYNFPKIIYDKHDSSENGWELFNQFINARGESGFIDNNEDGSDWDDKPESERTPADKIHKNRNIIQPMPYVLHILQVGFSDAGYQLAGDILSDKDLLQRVVFHSKSNYTVQAPTQEQVIKFTKDSADRSYVPKNHPQYLYNRYTQSISIKKGKYIFQGSSNLLSFPYFKTYVRVYLGGEEIFLKEYNKDGTIAVFFDFINTVDDTELRVVVWTFLEKEKTDEIAFFQVNTINGIELQNRNKFGISEFVPPMTFGEFVRILKNWKNYDISIHGRKIYMNYLSTVSSLEMKDISSVEIKHPKKTFLKKRSFNIEFPRTDEQSNNAYIDIGGVQIGGIAKEDTTKIQINGYCLPLQTHRGQTTAAIKVEDESVLALVYYDGLTNEQNLAKNPGGLMLPDILSVLRPWYQQRIESNEFRWSFFVSKNKWRHIDIKDTVHVYGKKAWIKEINKNTIDKKHYQIDITVEVVR